VIRTTPIRQTAAWPGREGRTLKSSGAEFDQTTPSNSLYRYLLWREYEPCAHALEQMTFILLNPSTADGEQDDPTIRRCIDFALRRDYLRIEVVNLFAFRSTDPKMLAKVADPVGRLNDPHILASAKRAAVVVCAWGANGPRLGRGVAVKRLLRSHCIDLHHFGLTNGGQPKHPLYLRGDSELKLWRIA
jgi:hypothetical protein